MEIEELKNEIYRTYYEINPKGDARYELWPAVLACKGDWAELNTLLINVQEGWY